MDWQKSVFRITGPERTDKPRGTGFAVARDGNAQLIVTCWHVVETIGLDRLRIMSQRCELISDPGDGSLDLAVLRVPVLSNGEPLPLLPQGAEGLPFLVYGFGPEGRRLSGKLGQRISWSHPKDDDLVYWDYYLNDQAGAFERIKNGYSGSPIYDPAGGHVVAVVTHRVGDDKGFAIDVSELRRVYPQTTAMLGATMPQPLSDASGQASKVASARAVRRPSAKFLVAFSFAGEYRELVRKIAAAVESRLGYGTVFLDEWFEHYLAGADADLKLQSIYGERSELVVVCVSERYGGKPWTLAEHEAIRARSMQARMSADERDRDRILPIRVGDGDVKGIHFNAIVPDVRDRTPDASADLILARLSMVSGDFDSSRGNPLREPPLDGSSATEQASAAQDTPRPTVTTPTSKPSERRRQALQVQLALLTAQWQAALEESAMTSGAAQVRAAQQAEQLEQRITEIERYLGGRSLGGR